MIRVICALGLLAILLLSLPAGCGGGASVANSPTTKPLAQTPHQTPSSSAPLTVLSSAEGNVMLLTSGAAGWVAGVAGTRLNVDDTIKTDAGAKATITFFDASTIELDPFSEIKILELKSAPGSAVTSIRLRQEVGLTLSRVKQVFDPASRYEVETPSAIAAVRGTEMYVAVLGFSDSTGVYCVEGNVVVAAGGQEVHVPPGYQSFVIPGGTPTPPEQALEGWKILEEMQQRTTGIIPTTPGVGPGIPDKTYFSTGTPTPSPQATTSIPSTTAVLPTIAPTLLTTTGAPPNSTTTAPPAQTTTASPLTTVTTPPTTAPPPTSQPLPTTPEPLPTTTEPPLTTEEPPPTTEEPPPTSSGPPEPPPPTTRTRPSGK